MNIVLAPRARQELANQLGYLIDKGAITAARRLEQRLTSYITNTLSRFPRSGNYITHRALWECWVPGTRLIVWYRFTTEEMQIVRVWHSAQDRSDLIDD